MQNFIFLMTLVIVRHCLGYTTTATYQLQGSQIHTLGGLNEVRALLLSLQNARNCIGTYHSCWFKEACNIAGLVDATVKHPRLCGRQIYRDNNPANDTSEYFKVNVSIPFLDHLLQELSFRFSDKNSVVIKGLSLIPKLMIQQYASTSIGDKRSNIDEISEKIHCISKKRKSVNLQPIETEYHVNGKAQHVAIQRIDKEWKKDFQNLCIQYLDDLPNPANISQEVDNWESTWIGCPLNVFPATISETLKVINHKSFPNISTIVRIMATLPFTSCTCERAASSLRIIITYLRSTMGQDRLSSLATLYTQKDIPVNTNSVITKYAIRHNRRMKLSNILIRDESPQETDDIVISEIY